MAFPATASQPHYIHTHFPFSVEGIILQVSTDIPGLVFHSPVLACMAEIPAYQRPSYAVSLELTEGEGVLPRKPEYLFPLAALLPG